VPSLAPKILRLRRVGFLERGMLIHKKGRNMSTQPIMKGCVNSMRSALVAFITILDSQKLCRFINCSISITIKKISRSTTGFRQSFDV